jgi:small basic protein (TIGR04137 family)
MSLHSSLKTGGSLAKKRSVLNRTERIARLAETKGFDPNKKAVLGLQKTSPKAGPAAH